MTQHIEASGNVREDAGMNVVSEAEHKVLAKVARTKKRPDIRSKDWDVFVALSDAGLLEDCGGGHALITKAGSACLGDRERRQ